MDKAEGKPVAKTGAGLEGVVAAESAIGDVDGVNGVLIYQGSTSTTSPSIRPSRRVVFLLWHGRLPKREELDALRAELAANGRAARGGSGADAPLPARRRADGRAADGRLGARLLRPGLARPLARGRAPHRDEADGAASRHRRRLRAAAQWTRAVRAEAGAQHRLELPLHAHGRGAFGARGAHLRRLPHPPRRPRAERLDLHGAASSPARSPTCTAR